MKKMKLIYKESEDACKQWDYLHTAQGGWQVWGCSYTLDKEATKQANDGDVLLDYINDDIMIYTDDITDEELDTLGEANYDRLSWDDYEYYCYAGELEDWARYNKISCVMDCNNIIIDVTVDDCGRIICEEDV